MTKNRPLRHVIVISHSIFDDVRAVCLARPRSAQEWTGFGMVVSDELRRLSGCATEDEVTYAAQA